MNSSELHSPNLDPLEPRKRRRHRHHRHRRRFLRVSWFSVSVMVLLLIVAVLGFLIMFPPPAPPVLTKQQQEQAQAHFQEIQKGRDLARKDAVAGKPHPGTERVTETDLNAFLTTNDQAQAMMTKNRIEDAFVRLGEGAIRATASREVRGVPVSVTATIRPTVTKEGRLVARLDGLDIGRLGMPASVAQGAAREMITALTARLADPALKYKSVSVDKGAVTLTYDTH